MKRDGSHRSFHPRAARAAERQVQRSLRARHAHVHQPALLVDRAALDRLAMRQDPLLDADEEHVRELEPLRRVQRRQAHDVRIVAVPAFEHRDQRDHLRELEQRLARRSRLCATASRRSRARSRSSPAHRACRTSTTSQSSYPMRRTSSFSRRPAGSRFARDLQVVDQRTELRQRLAPPSAAPPRAAPARATQRTGFRGAAPRCADSLSSVVCPTPRRGVVTARMNAGSSSSFASSRRYATMSLISARSKYDCAARDLVRHVLRAKRGLEDARLVIAAIQDRVIAEAAAMLEPVREQAMHDDLGLGSRRPRPAVTRIVSPCRSSLHSCLSKSLALFAISAFARAQDPHRSSGSSARA